MGSRDSRWLAGPTCEPRRHQREGGITADSGIGVRHERRSMTAVFELIRHLVRRERRREWQQDQHDQPCGKDVRDFHQCCGEVQEERRLGD